ncbi:hypothetical protein BDY21DRAFT_293983 [Lineolata rhizophorae]|uniref:D-3-phosphoglycerate dehydrogenase n=1 Tax=Lineolata rhizophorae TaxID=578093 RepID=A0A6A6NMC7_9PEZI|nr:hypothetical protein BDY21DRAFT_293983 [Lineolata rhizophorae]
MPIPASPAADLSTRPIAVPKVLIPEKVSSDGLELLRSSSFDVHERKGLSPDELRDIIADYDAIIVRSETQVHASLIEAGKKLKVIARAGVGVDNVDVTAATRNGVLVVNSPSGNINAAAEHTIALMMAVARNIPEGYAGMKAGKWERSKLVGVEVKGKTLAIIGLGKVGLTVARQASGLGMRVIGHDPFANLELCAAANVAVHSSLSSMLSAADFLTIHTPLIASTKGMVGKEEIKLMKKTARVLNVARGGTIDERALLEALDEGRLAGAGVDVWTTEPPWKSPEGEDSVAVRLASYPKVVCTPHLGASTVEAQESVSVDVCEQVVSILCGELPRSAVNAPLILPEEAKALQPFVDLVERMGSLYMQYFSMRGSSTSTGELSNARTTFDLTYGGAVAQLKSTRPLFAALVKGLLSPLSDPGAPVNVNIVNAELVTRERGIAINEHRDREADVREKGYSSFVTLRARVGRGASQPRQGVDRKKEREHFIQGFVSGGAPYISRMDRFRTNFVPLGTHLICRNFDSCGKIGFVGSRLGEAGVNIRFMSVAPALGDDEDGKGAMESGDANNEALMILGVDRPVEGEVVRGLISEKGVLEANVVTL